MLDEDKAREALEQEKDEEESPVVTDEDVDALIPVITRVVGRLLGDLF